MGIDKNSFKHIEKGFFFLNYNIFSNIECWLFDNFTLTNIIQNKSNNRLNKFYISKNKNKKEFYKLKEILINNYPEVLGINSGDIKNIENVDLVPGEQGTWEVISKETKKK